MGLIEEFESTGNWLFRRRGGLPLITVVLVVAGLQGFAYPFGSHRWDQAWEMACFGVSLLGFGLRVFTVGFAPRRTSGRNTKKQVADTLNTTGIYSVVRNPLYLGNFMIGLGEALFMRVWWVCAIYALSFMLYYERIIFAEEMFLRRKFGEAYVDWTSKTPAFLPRFSRWTPPERTFDFRKACRGEHQTMIVMVAVFYFLEAAGEYRLGNSFLGDRMWNVIALVALVVFVAIRILYKAGPALMNRGRSGASAV